MKVIKCYEVKIRLKPDVSPEIEIRIVPPTLYLYGNIIEVRKEAEKLLTEEQEIAIISERPDKDHIVY